MAPHLWCSLISSIDRGLHAAHLTPTQSIQNMMLATWIFQWENHPKQVKPREFGLL